jgi:hypothetical protein
MIIFAASISTGISPDLLGFECKAALSRMARRRPCSPIRQIAAMISG